MAARHEGAQGRAVEARELQRRAEQLDELRGTMLSALSHELRTPLTVILGYADLLLDGVDGRLGQGQRECVEAMRDAALRLQQMLDDATALARARTAPHIAAFRIDLAALAGDAVDAVRPTALEKGLRLGYQAEARPVWVRADPGRLRRAVDHLLDNAVKFTGQGSVAVCCRAQDGVAALEVRDTGIGITSTDVDTIFDDFRQVDRGSTRRFGGLGLGLALVRAVVEEHSGCVDVESRPGYGSTFTVSLPICRD
jgi:signal transduction histidine kinase